MELFFILILIQQNLIKNRTMQKQKCSFLLCQAKEKSMEEHAQQAISSLCAYNYQRSEQQQIRLLKKSRLPKPVFSFRLNCFRDYDESDKKKNPQTKKMSLGQRQIMGFQCRKSMERQSIKFQQENSPQYSNPRRYISPSLRNTEVQEFKKMENMAPKCSMVQDTFKQSSLQHYIPLNGQNKINYVEQMTGISSSLAGAYYSSKASEAYYGYQQPIQSQKHPLFNQQQIHYARQLYSQPKTELKNTFYPPNQNKSTQKIDMPSFTNIVQDDQRQFFENVNTIKTIFTSNEQRYNSCQQSCKQFDTQQQAQDQMADLYFISSKTFKKVGRNKKKTAYFGYKEDSDKTERSIIDQLNFQPFRQKDQNRRQLKQSQSKGRKVRFIVQAVTQRSNLNSSRVDVIKQNVNGCQAASFQPSLHNIIADSSQKQKVSIQNSTKEMQFVDNGTPEDNRAKFRHVNTIKSIGGQSIFSDNSYIDIKFMQSINQKRAVIKLV